MPALDNVRQEKFCLALFQPGTSATQAYKDAGYTPANDNVAAVSAHHLLRNPNVARRMSELKEEQAKAATLTRDEILEKILETHKLATERGQSAAALRALEMLGQELHGMFSGRTQIDPSARLREMSDDELIAALDRNLALLGLPRLIVDHSGESGPAGPQRKTLNSNQSSGTESP